MHAEVRTYYLELTTREHLRRGGPGPLAVSRAEPPDPALNKRFYEEIGREWQWVDRLPWSGPQWRDYVNRPKVQTWVATVNDAAAGYFELERQASDDVEIKFFGLLAEYRGRGLGGALLDHAVRRAWAMGASRVVVNTCSLDHPDALSNYLSRGFRVYKEETRRVDSRAD